MSNLDKKQLCTSTSEKDLKYFKIIASNKLNPTLYRYIKCGASNEVTKKRNKNAYNELLLWPRVLVDVSQVNLTTTILGKTISSPIMIAPTAFHQLINEEGEIATVKACESVDTIMVLSNWSSKSIEEVSVNCKDTSRLWFQTFFFKDKEFLKSLIKRVEDAGYSAIVITIDAPTGCKGCRKYPLIMDRHANCGNFELVKQNLETQNIPITPQNIFNYMSDQTDSTATWDNVKWIKSITSLPIIVKGIIHPLDAKLALASGVNGIIVSNHGGRQLDSIPSTIEVLPHIIKAVGGTVEVYIDGGIRRGSDILKAIALGAKAVLIGRPILWGLAEGGQKGVTEVLIRLINELRMSLALSGYPNINEVSSDILFNNIN